ncbi:MAG: hypothetical protein ACYDAY_11605 [Candidatus Dormibacteria bacterium]
MSRLERIFAPIFDDMGVGHFVIGLVLAALLALAILDQVGISLGIVPRGWVPS